jgi:diguanylate cyclase
MSSFHLQFFDSTTWLHFGIWTLIITFIRFSNQYFNDLKSALALLSSVELAALIILPFPLFCFSIMVSFIIFIIFNNNSKDTLQPKEYVRVAVIIISGLCAASVYSYLLGLTDFLPFSKTLAIIPAAFVFAVMKLFLQTTLFSIEQNKPFSEINTLDAKVLLVESLMIAFGALVGGIYILDPSLILIMVIPIILLKKTLNHEANIAYVDGKTGLFNYRYFDEHIHKQFVKAAKNGDALSIIFVDMDYLRHINNKYGHVNGDKALQTVADILMESDGENNIPVRFGGEEFVLIIPTLSKIKVIKLAETIRKQVERTKITLDNGKKINVTISLGVATFPDDAQSIKQLISYADKAVYRAKHKGRNIVCHHEKRNK